MEPKSRLLYQLNQFDFNEDFLKQSAAMGFTTLQEILTMDPGDLVKHDSFSYHWLAELSRVLKQEGLIDLLQQVRENKAG